MAALVVGLFALVTVGLGATAADAQPAAGREISINADSSWQVANIQPSVTVDWNSLVFAMVEHQGRVYVGGRFGAVRANGGSATTNQSYLAAFDVNTGAWISSFRPTINGPVFALDVSDDGSKLLVGGEFTQVNGAANTALVALNPSNGNTITSFKANPNLGGGRAVVTDIEARSNAVYIGGNFTNVRAANGANPARLRLAKLQPGSGALIGAFNASAQGARVISIEISPDGSRLYVGGYFSSLNNQSGTDVFGAVNTSNGGLVSGVRQGQYRDMPQCCGGQVPFDIKASGNRVIIAAESHNLIYLRASDLNRIGYYHTATGGGDYQALAIQGNRLYAGGHYWANQNYDTASYNNVNRQLDPYRNNITHNDSDRDVVVWASAYNLSNGNHDKQFTPDISATSGVWAILPASNGSLWLGGDLRRAGNRTVGGFAKFSPVATQPLGNNLARDRVARQSSTAARPASFAVNRVWSGIWRGNYRWQDSRTQTQNNPWWEVDLGGVRSIGVLRLWKPGICCNGGLNGAKVFVSNTPLTSDDPNATANQSGVSTYTLGGVIRRTDVAVNRSGRYVRIQLPRNAQLVLDEVQVFENSGGAIGGGGSPIRPASCSVANANGGVRVNWTRAANDRATNFVVRRKRGNGGVFWAAKVGSGTTTWNDSGVVAGANYTYTVETLAGSARSSTRTCSPAPIVVSDAGGGGAAVKPAACSVALVNGNVRVTWTPANGRTATRYVVDRARNNYTNFFWAAATGSAGRTWTDTNVVRNQGQRYTYRVVAVNGSNRSNPKWCSPVPIVP